MFAYGGDYTAILLSVLASKLERAAGGGPDAGTIRSLLSDAELEREPVVIEFAAPAGLVLLSVYSVWNEAIDWFLAGAAGPPDARLVGTLFDVGAARLDGREDADHIQACLPRVEWGWVRSVGRA